MNTKDKILLAMYKLIAKHGYEKASIAMICEEVKIKKPSVYYYFKSKEEIFLALIDVVHNYSDLNIKKSFKKETFKEDLIREGNRFIDEFIEDTELIYVIVEFYNQANRIEKVKEKISLLEKVSLSLMEKILSYGVEIKALPSHFNVSLNSELLGLTLDAIGISLIQNMDVMGKKIWETSVNRMFLELENEK